MGFWQDTLKSRVPEYNQQENLSGYLDACGAIFDDLSDTIKQHDYYKDYKKCAESRLAMLASQFALNPPTGIQEDMLRGIVRDLIHINQTAGTMDSIRWVFRLLNWEVTFLRAWIPSPERFDPRLRDLYPTLFDGDASNFDYDRIQQVQLKIGQPYRIGRFNQSYHADPDGIVIGLPKIGPSDIGFYDDTAPYMPTYLDGASTDASKLSPVNFLYGDAVTLDNGTYLYGRGLSAPEGTGKYYRIIGENYSPKMIRTPINVMSTPYIVVKVSEEDYEQFTAPYIGEDGEVYDYTANEEFLITNILINYFLHEYVRPGNVKVISITGDLLLYDDLDVDEEFIHTITAPPIVFDDQMDAQDQQEEEHTFPASVYPMTYGNTQYTYGAPTAHPINSISGIEPPSYGDDQLSGQPLFGTTEFDRTFSLDIDQPV